ncbi:hypothetical protein [Massilia rubra]|uniref:Uncharacterized protein n=1 Tax=Massilia rubra TaxID=2607910 RepID=A0ABX0LRK2_9BURK|nr:hypothetical protein [Massilia rubra]NHZ35343.1 hypothetical protein [Massilia rubra]
MKVVYFPDENSSRAQTAVGAMFASPQNKWVNLLDLIATIESGETVEIRPASEAEIKRADAYVALHQIGVMLGEKLDAILEGEPLEDVVRKTTAVRDAIESIDVELPGIVNFTKG